MPESNEVGDQQEYIDRNEAKQRRELASMLPEGTPVPQGFAEQSEKQFPTAEPVESRSGYLVEQSDLDELLKRLKLQPWQKQRFESWVDNLRQFHTGEQPESEVLRAE